MFAPGWTRRFCEWLGPSITLSVTARRASGGCGGHLGGWPVFFTAALLLLELIPAQPCCRHASIALLGLHAVALASRLGWYVSQPWGLGSPRSAVTAERSEGHVAFGTVGAMLDPGTTWSLVSRAAAAAVSREGWGD